jgi:outer membrane protein TolC
MRKVVMAAAMLLLALVAVSAERITVDRAVELAIANNLSLASDRIGVESKKLVRDTALNAFVPSVNVGTSLSRPNRDPNDPVDSGAPRWYLGLSLSAQLQLNLALRNGIRKTVLDYESGLLGLETAEKQLARDVRKSFYNLLLLRENIELMEQTISAAEKRHAQARANYQAGLVPEYTVLSAQVALENLKPALEDLRNGYDAALGGFHLTLGLDRKVPLELDGAIEITPAHFDAQQLIDSRILERLDIRGLDMAIASLINGRGATINQKLAPTVALLFTMDPTYQNEPWESGWLSDLDANWAQRQGAFVLSLTMPLDGFVPSSRTKVEVAGLDAQIRQTELSRQQALQGAEVEIETLTRNLDKARTSVTTLELNVSLADRAYRLAEEAYNAGSRELLEVQNAELELRKARLEVLKAKYTYITGLLDLEYAVNKTLREEGTR